MILVQLCNVQYCANGPLWIILNLTFFLFHRRTLTCVILPRLLQEKLGPKMSSRVFIFHMLMESWVKFLEPHSETDAQHFLGCYFTF